MFELQDHAAFKDHLRDFLVQTKSFSSQDNADLFADEAAAAREVLPILASAWLPCGGARLVGPCAKGHR